MAARRAIEPEYDKWDAFVPPGRRGVWPWRSGALGTLGVLGMLGIAAAAIFWYVPHFEKRLDNSAKADLKTAGIDASALTMDWTYRDVLVEGQLPQGVSAEQLEGILRDTDGGGVRGISVSSLAAPERAPQVAQTGSVDVTATLADGVLVLAGTVLTEGQKSRLDDAAKRAVGPANVDNQLMVSGLEEANTGADARVDSLANSIAGLDGALSADARLSATDFRFNATVPDESVADELLRRRGSAGDLGLVISGDIIARKSAPGGSVDVAVLKDNGRIILSGTVLNESQRQQLVDTAGRVVGVGNITDELVVTNEVESVPGSDLRVAALADALAHFDRPLAADARLTSTDFSLNASVEYEEDSAPLNVARDNARALGMTVVGSITAKQNSLSDEVALLQGELDLLADEIRDNVRFDTAKSNLDFVAKQTLDKVVDSMNRYPRPVVQISGHTDNTGDADQNMELSLERANAVSEYLENSGILSERLRAYGFGEEQPVASNEIRAGREQNRRVAFRARESFVY